MKTEKKEKTDKKRRKISLLTSMLVIFIASLAACISLTILLLSVMGRSVYAKVAAKGMVDRARSIAEETMNYINGDISAENYKYLLRSGDTEVIFLNDQLEPIQGMEPAPGDKPDRPGGGERPQGSHGGHIDDYLGVCKALYPTVTANPNGEFLKFDPKLGVIAAEPVTDGNGKVYGAVFLIKPVADISEASKSLLIVLVIASVAAGLLMMIPIYFIARWLTNPLKKLTGAAAELSSGDYSIRVEPDGSHEVHELGSAFNSLAGSLQENIGELTLERNRLRAVLEGLGEGIIAFDTDGRVTRCNGSAAELLGGSEENIERIPEFKCVSDAAKRVIATGEDHLGTFERDDRVIRLSVAAIEEEGGSVAGAVALLMDMTEAERLEQTRRDYVANVSHELRTPLASIRGIADMLNDGLVKNEADKQRYYGYIQKESIRLSTLINDLLELSRLQSGGVALKLQRMELYELIMDVASRASEAAKEREMTVRIDVPEGNYLANSNPDRVEQVLVSLMDNAVKHGKEGGEIVVGICETGDKWKISVENPADIERKDLEHLFERFYKADIARTGEGTGLGLAITEEVLRLMGETIRADYEDGVIKFTFTVAKYK